MGICVYIDTTAISQAYNKFTFLTFMYKIIPVLKWLPKYSIKTKLVGDITAGITVAVMHIPQGMAYGILAGVTPSSGLYMAFFPTLVYFVFGSSRHISVGTLSIISLMTLNAVHKYATAPSGWHVIPIVANKTVEFSFDINGNMTTAVPQVFTSIQVVTAIAFMCGIIQVCNLAMRLS